MEKIAKKIVKTLQGYESSSSSDSDDDIPSLADIASPVEVLEFGREQPPHKVQGGGKPADVLLWRAADVLRWRDKKFSGSVLCGVTAIWVVFEILEYHLLTLACDFLILLLAIPFVWSNAPTLVNKPAPNIQLIQLPEKAVMEFASALLSAINRGLAFLHNIISGIDAKQFLAVIAGLWVASVVGKCCNFITLFYILFVLVQAVIVIYEKYGDEIDSLAKKAKAEIKAQYAFLAEHFFDSLAIKKLV